MLAIRQMILYIIDAKCLEGYKVNIVFNNGRNGIADLRDELCGVIFNPLLDQSYFRLLKIDKELNTISWPNGADFAPEFLYYLAFKDEDDLQELFQKWGYKVSNEISATSEEEF